MDGSRVTQDLESLWFYTNMLTTTTHDNAVPSLTPPSINPNESQKKTEEERMEVELSGKVKCTKCDEKRERKRRKRNKSKVTKMEEVVGEFDNVKVDDDVGEFLRYDKDSSSYDRYDYEIIANHHQNNLPPLDDVVAMKQHLKSWARAVANSFK
ncbi:hypothetical protein Lal_00049441 [Lupinus albus]|uniref:Uncharacterized protein n=1 Tax=Lupinus albus TaxID=3870 RepID=A0A6A4PN98_LUPAL|nr:hypothetical protein Lalb_Chr12g0205021 [Lupinus albus]KAF1867014.1 hypothetical protein Lal_00049441 [Lupinus albus]